MVKQKMVKKPLDLGFEDAMVFMMMKEFISFIII